MVNWLNAVDEIGEICVSNPGVYAGNTYTEADKTKIFIIRAPICVQAI